MGFSRRDFLKSCALCFGGAAVGSLSTIHEVLAAGAADFNEYRALVCIFLYGGNDSFNMIIPTSTAEYQLYDEARASLAVPVGDLLPITPLTSQGGATFGFHPACAECRRCSASSAWR